MLRIRITSFMLILMLLEPGDCLSIHYHEVGIEEASDLQLGGRRMMVKGALKKKRFVKEAWTNHGENPGAASTTKEQRSNDGTRKSSLKVQHRWTREGFSSNGKSKSTTEEKEKYTWNASLGDDDGLAQLPSRDSTERNVNPELSAPLEGDAKASNALLALLNNDYHWDNGKPRHNPPINNHSTP
ncbi:hypothetical protein Dimus_005096 [Dionaea muscipula]